VTKCKLAEQQTSKPSFLFFFLSASAEHLKCNFNSWFGKIVRDW
jgi:hypothetical protein